MIKHKKYSSIENHYRTKFIQSIESLEDIDTMEFVCQEKVHGANFSAYITMDDVKYAKRNGFIKPNDLFYNHNIIDLGCRDKFLKAFKVFSTLYDLETLVLCGELCGGNYPHKDVESLGLRGVQKGVYYSPSVEFFVFDVFIKEVNKELQLLTTTALDLLSLFGVNVVPTIFKGTFAECMSLSEDFETRIPSLLHLPAIDNNLAEGFVIKPVVPLRTPLDERVMVKKKSEKWAEKASRSKGQGPIIKELTDGTSELFNELSLYVTDNRLANVLSKVGEITFKDFGRVQNLLFADIWEDFSKDFEDWKERWEIQDVDKAQNLTKKVAGDLLRVWIKGNL